MNGVVLRGLGALFFALGTIGIGVPLLPTVPLWILAAFCFARSSPALQRRIFDHPQFGATVRHFVEKRALTTRSKIISIAGAGGGIAASLWLLHPPVYVLLPAALMTAALLLWLATRPAPGAVDGD